MDSTSCCFLCCAQRNGDLAKEGQRSAAVKDTVYVWECSLTLVGSAHWSWWGVLTCSASWGVLTEVSRGVLTCSAPWECSEVVGQVPVGFRLLYPVWNCGLFICFQFGAMASLGSFNVSQ